MSDKVGMMLSILNMLDRGRQVTLGSLAERFGVSTKSAERYMNTLKLQFPVEYDRQRRSYVFAGGFQLKNVELTPEEQLVFGLARNQLKRLGAKMQKVLDSIERKMESVRPFPKHIVFAGEVLPPQVEENLMRLNNAIRDRRRVELTYRTTNRNDAETCRTVDPYYLLFTNNLWYLRGFCRLRKEPRNFALDKIVSLTVLDKTFIPDDAISPDLDLAGAFGAFVDGVPANVVLHFDKAAAPYLRRLKTLPGQKNRDLKDGALEVRCRVNGFLGIKPWIMRWLPHVEVASPKELRNQIRRELAEAAKKFGN